MFAGVSLSSKSDCKNYDDCSQDALKYVVNHGIKADKIIIAPNIYGNPQSYFSYVYISALEEMINNDIDEVILDITHGINYMPVLAKDAITLALATYVAYKSIKEVKEKKVKFTVYNSDPVTGNNPGPYKINIISETTFTQLSGIKYITSQLMNKTRFKTSKNWKMWKLI